MASIPITRVRTSHALTIKANGITVGLINGWNPAQARTVTPIFEVGTDDSGNPLENMPGNMTGLQIAISRFDTYSRRMEQAFNTPDLTMLTRQNQPFDVMEVWKLPGESTFIPGPGIFQNLTGREGPMFVRTNSPFTEEERFLYSGCWFSNLGRTLRADDNRIVNVNASLIYTKKVKVTGLAGDTVNLDFSLRLT
ncbi:MAG: hypothetical protein ACWGQW_03505 [bacterium]